MGSERAPDDWEVTMDTFPDAFSTGASVLVASAGDPTRFAIGLVALCRFGDPDDSAVVVTTTESADRTLETYEGLCAESQRPSVGFVDTTATHPSAPALYRDTSTVYIPSPGDLERLVVALSEVSGTAPPSDAARHLVVRSLTPILAQAPTERVCTVLNRVTGLRANDGLCLLGLDYTAHDRATIETLAEKVDGILWVSESAPETLSFDYHSTRDQSEGRTVPALE